MLPYWKRIVPDVPPASDFADAYPLFQPVFETMFNKFEDDKLLRADATLLLDTAVLTHSFDPLLLMSLAWCMLSMPMPILVYGWILNMMIMPK
jgi:hypothetical protein